jgi:hypothetical protein
MEPLFPSYLWAQISIVRVGGTTFNVYKGCRQSTFNIPITLHLPITLLVEKR